MVEAWTAIGAMKREMRPEQRKHLESMLWFLEDQYLGEGRSYVASLAFIELALKRPDHWITPFDHERSFSQGRIADSFLMEAIVQRVRNHRLDSHFEFGDKKFRYTSHPVKNDRAVVPAMTDEEANDFWEDLTIATKALLDTENHQETGEGLCVICGAPSKAEEHLPTCLVARVRASRFEVERVIAVVEKTHDIG